MQPIEQVYFYQCGGIPLSMPAELRACGMGGYSCTHAIMVNHIHNIMSIHYFFRHVYHDTQNDSTSSNDDVISYIHRLAEVVVMTVV